MPKWKKLYRKLKGCMDIEVESFLFALDTETFPVFLLPNFNKDCKILWAMQFLPLPSQIKNQRSQIKDHKSQFNRSP